ncbi:MULTISPECIES: LPXTG cell wall anchor domain-containing protein [Listeria]|uniref:LPXTG cell wall anchor domain-containing protein n=1 Tax=Listeria TaxID=1637 RepID=UPI000B596384|nr:MULTISPECIES: LPXTG cell wall anchor domain-containing protein [Listeria]
MKKSVKLGYGVLALSVGLALPTVAFASETDTSNGEVDQVLTEVSEQNPADVIQSNPEETGTEDVTKEQVIEAPSETAKTEKPALQTTDEANTANLTATPLATAKSGVKVEVNATTTPGYFVTAENGVALSFKVKPNVSSIGNKSVAVIATDGTTTEEITVNYVVQDTQKPTIELMDADVYLELGDDFWYADDFVLVNDNSDDYEVFFADGREALDTSKVGVFNTVIVARDAAGNEARVTMTYHVVDLNSDISEEASYAAPKMDTIKSTASDIYGKTRPYAYVGVIAEDSVTVLGTSYADVNGNFHVHLGTPLKKNQTIYIMSVDMHTFEYSDVAEYRYTGTGVVVKEVNKPAVTKTVTDKTVVKAKDPVVKSLPKTGDTTTGGAVAVGAIATLLAAVYLRKRS